MAGEFSSINQRLREKILKDALDLSLREYREYSSNWNLLTNKAQALAAGSGVFFVAIIGIDAGIDRGTSILAILTLIISVLAFFGAALFGFLALFVKDCSSVESISEVYPEVKDILEIGRVHSAHYENFLKARIQSIESVNNDLFEENRDKASSVFFGQLSFAIGIHSHPTGCSGRLLKRPDKKGGRRWIPTKESG